MSGILDKNVASVDSEVYEETTDGVVIRTSNIPHFEVHIDEGYGYSLTKELTIATVDTPQYYVLKTPADHRTKVRSRTITTGGGLRYQPSVSGTWVKGDLITGIRNLNGENNITSPVELYAVTSVTDEGAEVDVIRTPDVQGTSQNSVTYGSDGAVRVLSRDTEYLLKFDNIDNQDVWCIYNLTFTSIPDTP